MQCSLFRINYCTGNLGENGLENRHKLNHGVEDWDKSRYLLVVIINVRTFALRLYGNGITLSIAHIWAECHVGGEKRHVSDENR
jgi:hypothetical protein